MSISLSYFNKKNPCPVCGHDSGCRPAKDVPNGILCLRPDSASEDWVKVKNLNGGYGAILRPVEDVERDRQDWTEEKRQEWERKQRIKKETEARDLQTQIEATDLLDEAFSQRDRRYRQYLKSRPLSDRHYQNLKERGLSARAIERGSFGSSESGGMICPAFWGDKIIGFQWRKDPSLIFGQRAGGKYIWSKSPLDSKLPNREMPITAIGQAVDGVANFAEGILKPFIAQAQHGGLWIGAAGANFPALITQKAIKDLGVKRAIFWADGGSRVNPHVKASYRNLKALLGKEGIDLQFADWGQWDDKSQPDCDELPEGTAIAFKSAIEFFGPDDADSKSSSFGEEEKAQWKAKKFEQQFKKYKRHYRYTPTHAQAQEYFYIPTPAANTLTAVRSGLGTGKTTWLAQHFFGGLKGEGILQFGDKNGLLLQTCTKTRAYHIWADDESREMMADPAGRFAACIHSIIKFDDQDLIEKNLVFDEASTLIKTLLFSSHLKKPIPGTNTPRQLECIRKLKLALSTARRIVLMDAYLSDFDVAFFSELMPEGMTVNKILNRSPKTPRKYIIHQGSVDERGKLKAHEYSGLLASIQRAIGKGESIALATDSQHWLKTTTERLGGEENCHRIDRETSGEDWAKEFLKSPDDYLISAPKPVLGYSPSMGEGVSVDSPFDRIFGHFTATVGTTAQSQMLGRIRNCSNDIEVFIVPRGLGVSADAPVDSGVVTALWEECLSAEGKTLGGSYLQDYIDRLNRYRFLVDQAGQLETVRNFERLYPRECLKFILELNGGEVIEATPDADKGERDEQKNMSEALKDSESASVVNAEAITDSEAKTLQGKGTGLKREQQLQLERYQITSQFPGLEESAIWGPDVVRLLKFDDKDIRSQVETWILYNDDSTDFSAMRRDDWTHQTLWMPRTRFLAVETLKKLPLKPILEASQFSSDSEIITDWVRSVTQMSPKECKARLGWKPRKDIQTKPIQSLNELLAKFGLKAKRIKGDGKTRFYSIDYSKHETQIWPILETGRRQRMLEKLAKIQEFDLAENSGCNPEGEGNPATDITPLNIYRNNEVMSVDYPPNYRNESTPPHPTSIALDSGPVMEATGSQWIALENKTTVLEWAAILREVAESSETDAETLAVLTEGLGDEDKRQIWKCLSPVHRQSLKTIAKTFTRTPERVALIRESTDLFKISGLTQDEFKALIGTFKVAGEPCAHRDNLPTPMLQALVRILKAKTAIALTPVETCQKGGNYGAG
jgi:hypothetical protein